MIDDPEKFVNVFLCKQMMLTFMTNASFQNVIFIKTKLHFVSCKSGKGYIINLSHDLLMSYYYSNKNYKSK